MKKSTYNDCAGVALPLTELEYPIFGQSSLVTAPAEVRITLKRAADERKKFVSECLEFWCALRGEWYPSFYLNRKVTPLSGKQVSAIRSGVEKELRSLVDAWIDSGLRQESEQPWSRRLSSAQEFVILSSLRERPSSISITAGAGLTLDDEYSMLSASSSPLPIETERALVEQKRIREALLLKRSPLDFGLHVCVLPSPGENLEGYSTKEAIRLFLTVLTSGVLRFGIMRCKKCQKYNIIASRELYIRGWFCGVHRKGAATKASGQRERREKQQLCIHLAAEALLKLETMNPRPPKRAEFIAKSMKMNAKTEYHKTSKWVTRHMREIEQRATNAAFERRT